ncbi:hypothetical protein BJ742DRAFT_882949 [Cladochytrium replicatum]|nr:hypothetical protein BJ742DRAFT_882949 [Cladochytrium replicatum]
MENQSISTFNPSNRAVDQVHANGAGLRKSAFYHQQAADLRWLRNEEKTQLQMKKETFKSRQHADLRIHSKIPSVKKSRRKTIGNGSLGGEEDFIFQNEAEFQAFKMKYDIQYTDEAFEPPVSLSEVHDAANKTLERRRLMYSTAYRNKVRMRNLHLPTSVLNIVANSVNSGARRKSGVQFNGIVNTLASSNIVLPPVKPFLSKLTRHQPRDNCRSESEDSESVHGDHTFSNIVRPSIPNVELPFGAQGASVFGSDREDDWATKEDRLSLHYHGGHHRSRSMPSTSYNSTKETMVRAALARGDFTRAKAIASHSRRRSMVEQTMTFAYQQANPTTNQREQEPPDVRETGFLISRRKSAHELVNSALATSRRGPMAALQRQPVDTDHTSNEDSVQSELQLHEIARRSTLLPSGFDVPQIVVGEADAAHTVMMKQNSEGKMNSQETSYVNDSPSTLRNEVQVQTEDVTSQKRFRCRAKRHWEPLNLAAAAETRRTIVPTRLISLPQLSVATMEQQKSDPVLPPIPNMDRPLRLYHTSEPHIQSTVSTSNPEYSDYTARWHADLESQKQKGMAVAREHQSNEGVLTYYYYDHRLGSWVYATEQRPERGSSAAAKAQTSIGLTGWDAVKALPRMIEMKVGSSKMSTEDVRESNQVVRRPGLSRSVRFWKFVAPLNTSFDER